MTPQEERALYDNDHAAWCRYMAPRWIELFKDDPEKKRAAWRVASPLLRHEITLLRDKEKA